MFRSNRANPHLWICRLAHNGPLTGHLDAPSSFWKAPKAQRGGPQGAAPKARRGTECARPELSTGGVRVAPRRESSAEWWSRVTLPHRIYATTCCMVLPPRFHGQSLGNSATRKKPLKADCSQGLVLVAGIGFEPMTFRL